jgi:hypothetical protein
MKPRMRRQKEQRVSSTRLKVVHPLNFTRKFRYTLLQFSVAAFAASFLNPFIPLAYAHGYLLPLLRSLRQRLA